MMADVVAPYHPLEANYDATREPPSARFLLGTHPSTMERIGMGVAFERR